MSHPSSSSSVLGRRALLGMTGRLGLAGGLAGTVVAGSLPTLIASAGPLPEDLFTLGVASGDPWPDSVVLWTRLAADPVALDGLGGMPQRRIPVQWEVATDDRFARVVRRGTAVADPSWAHSVHVEPSGLEPDREYWYRFRVGQRYSPVGRTRTAPAPGARLASLDFAYTSCQNYPAGHFTALSHIAAENLDLVCHLGDYIYEGSGASAIGRSHLPAAEIFSLADYRVRHGQYKTDPDLQAAHASAPWITIPDDHEVENNYGADLSQPDTEPDQDPAVFLQRRAAAYKAMYEHLPYRRASMPAGPDMQLYRRFRYGTLAEFSMLDNRQYRSRQAGQDARWDPARSYLGAAQETWLLDGLGASSATWQVIGNQAVIVDTDTKAGPGESYSTDNWQGYAAARQRFFQGAVDRGVDNLVVITGDAHRNTAADMLLDFRDPASRTIGAEFLGTSVTSGGDGVDLDNSGRVRLAENPHIKFMNVQRGYQRVHLTPQQWQLDYLVLPYVTAPGAPISRRARAIVEAGRPGIADIG